MSEALLALVATECRHAFDQADGDFEAKSLAAMRAARNHWMVTDENAQYQGAVCVLYERADDHMKERIKATLDLSRALSAAQSGVPVDFGALPIKEDIEPFPLLGLWRKTKDDR